MLGQNRTTQTFLGSERRQSVAAGTVLDKRESAIELVRPTTLAQVQDTVRRAHLTGAQVRLIDPQGSAEAAQPGVAIDLRGLRGLVSVDPAAGTATFLAGTTIDQAATQLEAEGLSMVGAPSDAKLTLGAGVVLGGHSGAPRDASFPASVAGVTLIDETGAVLRVSASRNPHFWSAARLSLGALGIVTEVTVRVRRYRALRVKRVKTDLRSMLRDLPEARSKVDYYVAAWRPGHDGVKLTLGWLEDASPAQVAARRGNLSSALHAQDEKAGLFSRLRAGVRRLFGGGAERLDERREGPTGSLAEGRDVAGANSSAVTMEYQFPLYKVDLVLQALHDIAQRNRAFSGVQTRLGMVARDDVWLSPAYGQDVVAVALDVSDASGRNLEALRQAEELFIYLGGLPNWAGWNTFTAGEAADVMPRYSDFVHIARDLDPDAIFRNAVADRLVH